ncbi:MAG: helix-turn-helix domain-containing protein [Bacillota bacterium]
MNSIKLEEFLTPDELSSIAKVKPNTLAVMRMQGRGPRFVKVGRLVRYPGSAVREWLSRTIENTAQGAAAV